jgi:hypothetical protein
VGAALTFLPARAGARRGHPLEIHLCGPVFGERF